MTAVYSMWHATSVLAMTAVYIWQQLCSHSLASGRCSLCESGSRVRCGGVADITGVSDRMQCGGSIERWRKWQCVVGGFCAMCIAGHFYIIGNLGTYLESYLKERGDYPQEATWLTSTLVTCVFLGSQVGTVVSGSLARVLGSYISMIIGLVIIMVGVAMSCWTVQVSSVGVIVTFGALTSVGMGLVFGSPYSALDKYKFKNLGLVSAVVSSGFGGGAVVFNVVISAFINPQNRAPDKGPSQRRHFSQGEILDRVPFSFLVLVALYAVLFPVAVWGTRPPPPVPPPGVAGDDVTLKYVPVSATSGTERSRLKGDNRSPSNGKSLPENYQTIR
ncbi:apicoplast pyruvate carrier 1-like [Babylonia areolata]|uniref:apicoplast pyruvate carrier 1-like n=1 Tax=Babylonia areolata TaxID=304850 RepID=UPI003FD3E3B2